MSTFRIKINYIDLVQPENLSFSNCRKMYREISNKCTNFEFHCVQQNICLMRSIINKFKLFTICNKNSSIKLGPRFFQ